MPHGADWSRSARPLGAAHPRLDRRAVEPRALALVLRARRRRALPIINYTGGTEISRRHPRVQCPSTPLKPCSFSGPIPGHGGGRASDEDGRPVRGAVGELVVRAAVARDDAAASGSDPERYIETYWSRWPDVWVHGDWAAVDDDGLLVHPWAARTTRSRSRASGSGRPRSSRCSSAHPAVNEAAAIGVPRRGQGRERSSASASCGPATSRATQLRARADRGASSTRLGKALKPEACVFVRELPKTRNAKVMRRVIRATYLGQRSRRSLLARQSRRRDGDPRGRVANGRPQYAQKARQIARALAPTSDGAFSASCQRNARSTNRPAERDRQRRRS